MGNSYSNANPNTSENIITGGGEKNLEDALDYIATYYILTLDFQSLRKLYQPEYCNELVILTSEIINRYFSEIEIQRLADRIENSGKVLFLKKADLQHLELDPERKRDYCNYIAKFYIKIAHIFAAILMTINPEYTFVDSTGKKESRKLSEKDSIPHDAVIEKVNANLCDSRISALKGNQETEIKPQMCSVDIYSIGHGDKETLLDVPGIPELMDLYYDAEYDYQTGDFKGMTEETRKRFEEDLARFYTVFTGNEALPESIKKFSDIKLKDYSKICGNGENDKDTIFERESKSTTKEKLFADYAKNLKQMMASVNEKQQKLLEVINRLFVYVKDPRESDSEKKVIRVNPELTDSGLQDLIEETRELIVELYLKCETDFAEGVKLYEAIVESRILETAQNQIETLKKEAIKLFTPSPDELPKTPIK